MSDSPPPPTAESADVPLREEAASSGLPPIEPDVVPADVTDKPPVAPSSGSAAQGVAPSSGSAAGDVSPSADAARPLPQLEMESTPPDDLDTVLSPVRIGPGLSFGFNLGKISGHGEDSDPIVRDGRELGLVGVFDGMGGAGGTVYETPDGARTGAYLASRVARDVVEQRMVTLLDPEWNLNGSAAAQDLHRSVRAALQDRLAQLNAPASGLRSRLLRALPTTMALAALQRRQPGGDRWACHALWAGDSRAYLFDPVAGAQQLTVDDIKDHGDAMANLRQDSVVSNAMSADTDFVVHHHKVELTAPFLVLAATDGCFGYLASPMHFEYLVLAALRDSPDTDSWSAAVRTAVSAVTGDDAAMAVLGVGADHQQFQDLFAERTAELEKRWIEPLDALAAEVERRERELEELRTTQARRQAQLWARYKPSYEHYLARPAGREAP